MADWGKIARRSFLIGSAAVAGGVAFGVLQYRRDLPNPLQGGEGQTVLTPHVIITPDGVTLIAPRAEMGQGVHTTLPALIAEELDVAWDQIRVIHGPAAQAYFNSAMVRYAVPFVEYDRPGWQEALIEAMTVAPKTLGLQITGGSTSVIDAFEPLRRSGAAAREVLKQAAAARWSLPVGALDTRDGQVIAPDGTMLSYAALAEDAARIEPPRNPSLRPASQWTLLGRSMPRTDVVAKSTGTATFATDVKWDGMRFATVRMCPRLGGDMLSYDATRAEAMPGVDRVIDLGAGIAVVARNTWLAMQAAEAVEIDWGPAPYPDSSAEMLETIRAGLDGPVNSTLRNDGDADAAPGPDDIEVTADYTTPWLAHATMEPMSATALHHGNTLEIWTGTQAPGLAETRAAQAIGLSRDAVTVHTTFLGGGFGRRVEIDYAVQAAQIAAAMPGTPIRMTWTREEDMRHDYYRPASAARLRGVIRNGRAHLLDAAVASPSVMRQSAWRYLGVPAVGPDKVTVEGLFDQPYAIPNYRARGHLVDLAVPAGSWRAVGYSHNTFYLESFLDEMAHAAGRDPLAFRLDLARAEWTPAAGVLEAVGEMSGWTGATPEGIGRGVAMSYSFQTPVAVVIEVADQAGAIAVTRAWMACDVSTALDPAIIEAQMVSGLTFGLSAAIMGEITFEGAEVQQGNFPDYDALRLHQVPRTQVRILETQANIGGVGEAGLPPAGPALANAVFDLTGARIRDLPLNRQVRVVP